MDFNNLNLRLERIYTSLGERYDYDVDSNIKSEIINKGTHKELRTTFGKQSSAELANTVLGAIGAIADVKDHLKNKLTEKSLDPNAAEEMINDSFELCLILDLNNKDKHGDPLRRSNRSNRNPRLKDISQGLSPVSPGKSSFSMNFDGQNVTPGPREGSFRIVTSASIIDEHGESVMSLDQMLDGAMVKIEQFISKYNLGD